jgi:hypothetical protein
MTIILQYGQILLSSRPLKSDSGAAMTDDAGYVSERFSPFNMRQQIIAASQKATAAVELKPGRQLPGLQPFNR